MLSLKDEIPYFKSQWTVMQIVSRQLLLIRGIQILLYPGVHSREPTHTHTIGPLPRISFFYFRCTDLASP